MIRQFFGLNRKVASWLVQQYPNFFKTPCYQVELKRRIVDDIERLKPHTILEIGGIDRPFLDRSPHYKYVGLDIEEKPNCNLVYDQFFVQSIEEPVPLHVAMIVSKTLLEHVPNNVAAVTSMFQALDEGGVSHHYIPSKWHPYSIALRIVGPALQKKLIATLRPAAVAVTGYPTFFDHCSPSAMEKLFGSTGFTDVDVKAFYRASDYFAFFLPAYIVVVLFENICLSLDLRIFASGFVISAQKPLGKGAIDLKPQQVVPCLG